MNFEYVSLDTVPVDSYLYNQDSIDRTRFRQMDSVYKLVLERLLPAESVDRVLSLDVDTLMIRDVCEVWQEGWAQMDSAPHAEIKPFVGLTPDMGVYFRTDEAGREFAFPTQTHSLAPDVYSGVNGGVIFADLAVMRKDNWSRLWITEIQSWLSAHSDAVPSPQWLLFSNADSNVFNYVLKLHPERVRLLPNDYNFQLYTIGFRAKPKGLFKRVVCARADTLAILHGNSMLFVSAPDEYPLKRDVWMLFFDRNQYADYSITHHQHHINNNAVILPPSERAKRLSRHGMVEYLREIAQCDK